MSRTTMPKVIYYDTVLNAPDGAYERVFSINANREDLAKVIGQGMTLALSMAQAEWESPAPSPVRSPSQECMVIPFPKKQTH